MNPPCKKINISRRKHALRITSGTVHNKDTRLFHDNNPIDTQHLACIFLGNNVMLTSSAIHLLHLCLVPVIFEWKSLPYAITAWAKRSSKNKQAQMETVITPRLRRQAARCLLTERNKILQEEGLRPVSGHTLLDEATAMQHNYAVLALRNGLRPAPKETWQAEGIPLHLIFSWLYGLAFSTISRMNLDPNFGIIHGDRGWGLVFDIADVYKPCFLSWGFSSARGRPYAELFTDFWARSRKVRLLKQMTLLLSRLFYKPSR